MSTIFFPLKPNAALQAPPMAEARHERRLLAVACKRWLGAVAKPLRARGVVHSRFTLPQQVFSKERNAALTCLDLRFL